jgi:chemotaxis protein methyltransferase CheR
MRPEDFDLVSALVKKRSGLVLSRDKLYLVETRLGPVARRHGAASVAELISKLGATAPESLLAEVTEAMTTNETSFFRDKIPFDLLTEYILPSLLAARAKQRLIRIWCAASSTGQEPYSIAMLLKEMPRETAGFRFEIFASDISNEVIERAKRGVYSQFEVQRGLPVKHLVKYFKKTDDYWQIDDQIRAMVNHRTFNLLDDLRILGTFDLIFCRNVLIYFDQPTKRQVLERIAQQLAPDGFLVLGAAETVIGVTEALKPCDGKRGLYVRADAATAAAPSTPALARAAGA